MKQISRQRANLYATGGDFCRIFREDMNSLYLLSLVLTADSEKAERCFVAGLDDCTSGNEVFKDWARSWARRVVIKNAIRAIAPGTEQQGQFAGNRSKGAGRFSEHALLDLPSEISSLLELPALERFVFVMSAFEGYSDHDSALLLGITRTEFIAARTRALERIGNVTQIRSGMRADAVFGSEDEGRNPIELAISERLAASA